MDYKIEVAADDFKILYENIRSIKTNNRSENELLDDLNKFLRQQIGY